MLLIINSTREELIENKQLLLLNGSSELNEADLYPLSLVIPFTVIYLVIFVFGVVGNIGTCVVIVKNKWMHTATNYYLFSLAISDLLLLISGLPPEMYRIWSPEVYIFGHTFCIIQSLASEISAYATVLTITAFTVERYIAICHPFLTQGMTNLSRAVRYIIIIWIVAIILAIPQAMQFGIEETMENDVIKRQCTLSNSFMDHAFEISTFVIFVGPMTLITVLYVLIGIRLHQSKKMEHCRSVSVKKREKNANRVGSEQRKIVKMLVAVVLAFFVCWAPFHAQRLLAIYLSTAPQETVEKLFNFYCYLMYTSGMLYFVSTTINPLLYHIMSKKFRKAFKETFVRCFVGSRKLRSSSAVNPNARSVLTENTEFVDDQMMRNDDDETFNGNRKNHRSSGILCFGVLKRTQNDVDLKEYNTPCLK